MLDFFSRYKATAIALLIISAIIIFTIYKIMIPKRVLPIYQPAQVSEELVDTTLHYVKNYHKIADFSLINQNGETVTQADYKGKMYVTDFFFTTCQTICPIMTDNMSRLQEELKGKNNILLLSHTVTPEIDNVERLKEYALEKGVDDSKWNLVTGDKKEIYDLARKSYLVAKDVPDEEYELIHTENFVLVDSKKRIRGYYDGTDSEEIDRLLGDIEVLELESLK